MRLRKDTEQFEDEQLIQLAQVADALAHPARLKLFRHIMQCNKSITKVCNKDLVESFDYAQATISQHMAKLVAAGLIDIKKQDRFSYYYANIGVLTKYIDLTKKFSIF